MDPFHISGVLRGESHSWLKFYRGERETTSDIIFEFPFAPIAQVMLSMTFQNKEKYSDSEWFSSQKLLVKILKTLLELCGW